MEFLGLVVKSHQRFLLSQVQESSVQSLARTHDVQGLFVISSAQAISRREENEQKELTSQKRCNHPRMTRNAYMRAPILIKDIVHGRSGSNKHRLLRLPQVRIPQLIMLLKPLLKMEIWKQLLDLRFRAAAVTSVYTHHLAQHLFDDGPEGGCWIVREIGECDICCFETAEERTAVV